MYHFHSNFESTFCKKKNSGDPDQTPRFAASDLGPHCLLTVHMSHKRTLGLYGLILANSGGPDEIHVLDSVVFYLNLHFLPKYALRGF